MTEHDLVVSGGTVVTATDVFEADVGIRDGRIATIGTRLGGTGLAGTQRMDAAGLLVLPGGIDTHCHIEQLQAEGGVDEETWESGSRACLAGGTTAVIAFSTQLRAAGWLGRWPSTAGGLLARWWITASTRSSPMRPTT